jgi:hypothetical protein
MTDKMNTWIDGNILDADDLMDTISHVRFIPVKYTGAATDGARVIAWSTTAWTTGRRETTDSGATWSNDMGLTSVAILAQSDVTAGRAVSIRAASGNNRWSTNIGSTWTVPTTQPANCTTIFELSYPVDAYVAAFGTRSGGSFGAWYSVNGGDDWTQATGTDTANFVGGDFFDANTGYAVTNAGAIWTTTNGGTNWTDTTNTITTGGGTNRATVYTITTDTAIIVTTGNAGNAILNIHTYVDSTNTATEVFSTEGNYGRLSKIIKSSNTNYYFIAMIFGEDTAGVQKCNGYHIFKSDDAGATWSVFTMSSAFINFGELSDGFTNANFAEYDTNKFLLADDKNVWTLNLRDDVS